MNERAGRQARRWLALCTISALCAACAPAAREERLGNEKPQASSTDAPSAPGAPTEIDLQVVDRAQYDEVLAGLRGKVVLVDFWATWCGPCVEQFPHTVELAERLDAEHFAAVSVSFDEPGDLEPIRQFLGARGASRLVNLVNRYGLGAEAIAAFEIASGALPSYKLYDRSGRLRRTFETDPLAKKQFTPQDISAAVEELLAE